MSRNPCRGLAARPLQALLRHVWAAGLAGLQCNLRHALALQQPVAVSLFQVQAMSGPWAVSGLRGMSTRALVLQQPPSC